MTSCQNTLVQNAFPLAGTPGDTEEWHFQRDRDTIPSWRSPLDSIALDSVSHESICKGGFGELWTMGLTAALHYCSTSANDWFLWGCGRVQTRLWGVLGSPGQTPIGTLKLHRGVDVRSQRFGFLKYRALCGEEGGTGWRFVLNTHSSGRCFP